MKPKTKAKITTVMFLAIIFGLTAGNLIAPTKFFSENENRQLQQMPEFSAGTFFKGKFGTDFEKYTTDQFIGRDNWVGLKTVADLTVQKKDMKGVYFAADDYLVERLTEQDIDLQQLEKNTSRVAQFVTACQQQLGADRVRAMIVPTAGQVLKEKLPPYAPTADQEKLLGQIESQLPQGSFINVLPTLELHSGEPIYYRTDHHWTTYGAFLAYRQWAESMGLTPWDEEDFTVQTVTEDFLGTIFSKVNYSQVKPDSIQLYIPKQEMTYTMDINNGEKQLDSLYNLDYLNKKDKYALFLDSNNPLVKITTNVKNGQKLFVVKDSYAHSFLPFAANHYEEIHVVDPRYFHTGVTEYIQQNGITDVLVLYNLSTFAEDKNLGALVK